ncbi:MAG: hypothetical protein WCH34_05235 [Bacteroidota bacterium]
MSYKKTKVITDIKDESESNIVTLSRNAYEGTLNNDNFLNLPVPSATWKSHIDDLIAKIALAKYGDDEAIINKNIALELVCSDWSQNSQYVNSVCNGDKVKAESSKMPIWEPKPKKKQKDEEAEDLEESGAIMVWSRTKPKGMISRLVEVTQTPDVASSWKLKAVTRREKVKIENLPKDVRTYVRIAIVVDENIVDNYGDVFSVMVT